LIQTYTSVIGSNKMRPHFPPGWTDIVCGTVPQSQNFQRFHITYVSFTQFAANSTYSCTGLQHLQPQNLHYVSLQPAESTVCAYVCEHLGFERLQNHEIICSRYIGCT
jgi:hypothetical protein